MKHLMIALLITAPLANAADLDPATDARQTIINRAIATTQSCMTRVADFYPVAGVHDRGRVLAGMVKVCGGSLRHIIGQMRPDFTQERISAALTGLAEEELAYR